MAQSVNDALSAQGIKLRDYRPGDHKTTCPKCSHLRRAKKEPCLSVKIEQDGGATWKCHHCAWTGGLAGSSRGYSPRTAAPVSYVKPSRPTAPQRPDSLIEYFGKRGIGRKTLERMGVYRSRHWFPALGCEADCIAFPYEWAGELRNVKYRDAAKNFAQEKGAQPVLYNADAITPGEDLIFVEGEIDVLTLIEAGLPRVVSLPTGAPPALKEGDAPPSPDADAKRYAALEAHAGALAKVSRFLIATDMDGPGERLADELARRLGVERCARVRFPTSCDVTAKDANECLLAHGKNALRECVAQAVPYPVEGLITPGEVASLVWDDYEGKGPQPLTTGFAELDKAWMLEPGQFVVVTGTPNHGKSRLLGQIAVNAANLHGWAWAIFSPESSPADHCRAILEAKIGAPFYDGPTPRLSPVELKDGLEWANRHFEFIEPGEQTRSIDWILERARVALLRRGIKGVVVDPYNEVEASRPANMSETEFVSAMIAKCKAFAKATGVVFVFVAHPTKPPSPQRQQNGGRPQGDERVPSLYDISGSANWVNKADIGVIVYRDFARDNTRVIVRKVRHQNRGREPGAVVMHFNPATRRFADQAGSFQTIAQMLSAQSE